MIWIIFENILKLLLACGMGVICGLFSYFLDYCFWPGSIFKRYLPWLAAKMLQKYAPDQWHIIAGMNPEYHMQQAEKIFWYKILGGCSVCLNIWIAMLSWTVICPFSFFAWYFCFPYIVMSSWMIRKLVGAEYD